MNATARFEWPIRPDRIEVSSLGYLAAAILLSARTPPPSATVHRLVPRRARPRLVPVPSDGLRRAAEA
ncbi:hypothetical protein FF100_15800 [Methylobacterium terricola]|uniref:Uncharacterized protein n=1 Tax=Methylobacterium terricola TaxID=2583531 RepID=A0A5C4LES5_9HYPH|nr:hypothetical protein [Methylobacterium terricola]TNC12299.1 hypothetical protein FF100_15800 [Methylobacterium terricola]